MSARPASSGFGFAFSPSMIKDDGEGRAAKRASRRTSAFKHQAERRKSPLSLEAEQSEGDRKGLIQAALHKPSLPHLARMSARLSSHSFSPLFSRTGGVSPTFTLDFSSAVVTRTNEGNLPASATVGSPPKLDFSASSVESSSDFSISSSAVPDDLLAKGFRTGRSIELDEEGNDTIDHQLEMLEELFPREMKTYSGSDFRPASRIQANGSAVGLAHKDGDHEHHQAVEEQEDETSSDYQGNVSEKSRISQLLSSWPKLSDASGEGVAMADDGAAALAKLEEHPSMSPPSLPSQQDNLPSSSDVEEKAEEISDSPQEQIHSYAASNSLRSGYVSSVEVSLPDFGSRPSSFADSIASRRSFRPSLSVDTAGTKPFAIKELEIIKRMKEKSQKLSRESKSEVNKALPGPPDAEPEAVLRSDQQAAVGKSSPRYPFPDMSTSAEKGVVAAKPRAAVGDRTSKAASDGGDAAVVKPLSLRKTHARAVSSESGHSGIVWSAVVEKFSEMAQEIAGGKDASKHSKPKNGATPSTTESLATHGSEFPSLVPPTGLKSAKSSPEISIHGSDNRDASQGITPPLEDPLASVSNAHESSSDILDSYSDNPETDTQGAEETGGSSVSDTPPHLASPLKRRSRSSGDLTSILKQVSRNVGLVRTDSHSSRSSESGGPKRSWTRPKGRVRTVRIQSHVAHVEGDYAAFLKRASMVKSSSSDTDTGGDAAETGSRYSKRSIGSKGGVENGLYRRGSMSSIVSRLTIATVGGASIKDMSRGSRFRRPSPFFACGHGYRTIHGPHQKGNPRPKKRLSLEKRASVDGNENLLAVLHKVKEDKRNKAPTPMIGELSFENDDPSKPAVKKDKGKGKDGPVRRGSKTKGAPSKPLPAHPAFTQGYAASTVLPSHRMAGTGAFSPPSGLHGRHAPPGHGSASDIGVSSRTPVKPGYAMSAFTPLHNSGKVAGSVLGGLSASRQQMLASGGSDVSLNPQPYNSSGSLSQSRSHANLRDPQGRPLHHKSSSSNISLNHKSSSSSLGSAGQIMSSGSSAFLQSSRLALSPPQKGARGLSRQMVQSPPQQSAGSIISVTSPPQGSLPLSNSFITMTPSRSELSVKSDNSGWETSSPAGSSMPNSLPNGFPRPPHTQQPHSKQMPPVQATRPRGPPPRSSTVPAAPGPAKNQLPLRSMSVNQDSSNVMPRDNRMSAVRPASNLIIDTELARARSRSAAPKARQSSVRTTDASNVGYASSSRHTAKEAHFRHEQQGSVGSMTSVGSAFPGSHDQTLGKPPRTASAVMSTMSNMFGTPKRPTRPKEAVSPTLTRYPRPPSAGPRDEALEPALLREDSDLAQSTRSNSTSRSGSAVKGLFGRFGKKK